MFVYIDGEYRNIEQATYIKPALSGTRCHVLISYPDLKNPVMITDQQASGILEYVMRRRVGTSSNVAMETVFNAVEAEKDISQHNGNGTHKTRKPRVLRNPERSSKIMEKAALARWAKHRGELELAEKYEREAAELKASHS